MLECLRGMNLPKTHDASLPKQAVHLSFLASLCLADVAYVTGYGELRAKRCWFATYSWKMLEVIPAFFSQDNFLQDAIEHNPSALFERKHTLEVADAFVNGVDVANFLALLVLPTHHKKIRPLYTLALIVDVAIKTAVLTIAWEKSSSSKKIESICWMTREMADIFDAVVDYSEGKYLEWSPRKKGLTARVRLICSTTLCGLEVASMQNSR